ncbi:hypothetical protein NVV94_08380 [Pseudomonas sp. LS1212]|uniref:hypothetical protein n=1 Tax=Pseudomonas sp. LS1212 TaxID=2972478 RepID=UPI00215B9149|nr:hypothetical protein [Pseudomonas sp. LS1212]UVJ45559.1 hypothetical protein NVV94_08380 [Pseudomonas sp. LS1212]
MKKYVPIYLAAQLVLTSCASTDTGSSQSTDHNTFDMLGAAFSVLLGLAVTQSSGDAAQGQQIMQQSLNVFSAGSSDSDDAGSAILASNSTSTPSVTDAPSYDAGTFDDSKYKPGSGCEKNLSYLSTRLKKFSPDMINKVRDSILATDMIAMMSTINQQGLSPQVAIQQSLQQADAFDQSASEALSTVQQVDAFGTTDAEFEKAINSGKVSVTHCSGIHDSALCAAIVNKYGAIASRASAANLMCFKRTNQWPL